MPRHRRNVVLIIADDLGRDDCGAFGNPKARTPNIDRLAREGMRFDRAFVTTSSCSPSRSSIITGRYPHNTGAEELHWPLPTDEGHLHRSKLKSSELLDRGRRQVAPGQRREEPIRRRPRGQSRRLRKPRPGKDGERKMTAEEPRRGTGRLR